jgi:hypothetical protein
MPHFQTEEPQSANLKDFVGKPVIIEPLQQMKNPDPKWTTIPWEVACWSDDGNGYQAIPMLIFAKAIVDVLPKAHSAGGWLGGIVMAKGSQLWLDSSNPLIMRALETEYDKISGNAK